MFQAKSGQVRTVNLISRSGKEITQLGLRLRPTTPLLTRSSTYLKDSREEPGSFSVRGTIIGIESIPTGLRAQRPSPRGNLLGNITVEY